MPRRSYDRQFKLAAAKMVVNEDLPVTQVAKELNIHYNSLYCWIGEFEKFGEASFPGSGNALCSLEYENKKLLQENKELREQLETLKKFQAFLKRSKVSGSGT